MLLAGGSVYPKNSKLLRKHIAQPDLELVEERFQLVQGQVMFALLNPERRHVRSALKQPRRCGIQTRRGSSGRRLAELQMPDAAKAAVVRHQCPDFTEPLLDRNACWNCWHPGRGK